tara:strand:+ start:387 stop:674 length:288 start_codon:yes stop_codon:yes gene_type:complete
MFFTSLLPIELWFKIYKIEHSMIQKDVLIEIKELSKQIEELNITIIDKNEKWNIIKWNNFKIKFSKVDFYGRCQSTSFKYFPNLPKGHSCALCQL